jgi:hypothetical protein
MLRMFWVLCFVSGVICVAGRAASACPAVAVGGCAASTVGVGVSTGVSAVIAAPLVTVPAAVTTFAVPTVITSPVVVQQTVVRQRPVRARSRTVIRSRSGGLGIF